MKKFQIILFFCSFLEMNGQVEKTSDLYRILRLQDSIFFELGFNQCNISFADGLVHKDFRLFHDKAGTQDRVQFFDAFKKNICPESGPKPIRKLDVKSLVIYPLTANGIIYGALVKGRHSFYLREKGKEDKLTSRAQFSHLYLLEQRRWLIREVISYDHQNQ